MEWTKKIDFKQTKYRLPAILYIPLLVTGYFFIDLFHTEKAEIPDTSLQTTEYLNPNLPEANIKGDLEGKYESMLKSYGKIDDFSAISNIDRDAEGSDKEEYESKYDESEIKSIEEGAGVSDLERMLMESAGRGQALGNGQDAFALSESERLIQSQQRERTLEEELQQALQQLREQQENSTQTSGNATASGTINVNEHAVSTPSEHEEELEMVKRIRQSSDYFHSLSENDPQPDLIKAIIDEDIKAVDGSRVRLRLLDDVEIGETVMRKGSYLYAIMSGFSSQRVKGNIKSILYEDKIMKVSLSLYDTDGLEGLYVPASSFRETSKDVASGAMSSNMSMNQGSYNNSLSQWGMQAAQNAYQRTTNAISKAIRKNGAKLKYGTFVYLVNGRETKNE